MRGEARTPSGPSYEHELRKGGMCLRPCQDRPNLRSAWKRSAVRALESIDVCACKWFCREASCNLHLDAIIIRQGIHRFDPRGCQKMPSGRSVGAIRQQPVEINSI